MDNTIGDRLKKFRENGLNLNQRVFASKVGISQPALAMFEKGDRELKEIHLRRICDEVWDGKRINESWLRTGEGGDENMFIHELLEDEYMTYVTEIGNGASDIVKKAIIKYGRLSPEDRKIIDNALEIAIKMIKEE